MALLDDFTRANAASLGANWTTRIYAAPSSASDIEVVSNQAKRVVAGYGQVWWNAATFGTDCYVGLQLGTIPSGSFIGPTLVTSGLATTSATGYEIDIVSSTSIELYRNDSSTSSSLLATLTTSLSVGDYVWLSLEGSQVKVWKGSTSSFSAATQIGSSVADNSYRSSTTTAALALDSGQIVDNFSAGTISTTTGWVADLASAQQTANQQTYTRTIGQTVAAGSHVMLHVMRVRASDTVASVTCNATGAVTAIDYAGRTAVTASHAVISVYLPSGATAANTISVTWTAAAANDMWASRGSVYSGLATTSWKDQTADAVSTGTTPTSTGAPNSTGAGVAVGYFLVGNAPTFTAGTGFAARTLMDGTGASNRMLFGEDKTAVVGTSYTADGTLSSSQGWAALVVVYKNAGALSAPVNTVAPAVTGNRWRTQTLTTTNGTWTNTPTSYTYQWQKDVAGNSAYSNIAAATASTYVQQTGDAGSQIRCAVTAVNASGSTAANSNSGFAGELYVRAQTVRVSGCGNSSVVFIPGTPGSTAATVIGAVPI